MEKPTERRRDKRIDVLELEKGLKPRVISRSATPQSVITDRSLSSVDEEEEEAMARNCVARDSCGTTGRCTAVSDSDGAVCEEEDVEDDDVRTGGLGEAEGEMPPAVAAQREFLARLEEKELRRQCCRRCLPACCMPCCKKRCGCCLKCCICPTCPSRKQCWNPCNYSGYFYAALVFACAVCGAVFVACGALQNNRQFLIAGSILCITSFGLFLHRCFRKSPYQPKGYPGFLDDDDFSSGGSGDYEPPPLPPPLPTPVIVTETEVGKTSTVASTPPDYPAATSDAATLQVPCNNANGRRPSTGYDPTRRRATVYDMSQRRRSSVYYDGGRRRSSTSIAIGMGSVSGDSMRGPYGRRGRAGGGSGILDLARRLSVAGGQGHGFNDGWNTSGSRLQHHYRRSCSYPWAMARPEHHYVEYV